MLVGKINVDNLKNSKKSTEFNELLAEYDMMRVSLLQEFTPESSISIDALCNIASRISSRHFCLGNLISGVLDHTSHRCKIDFKVNMKRSTSSI